MSKEFVMSSSMFSFKFPTCFKVKIPSILSSIFLSLVLIGCGGDSSDGDKVNDVTSPDSRAFSSVDTTNAYDILVDKFGILVRFLDDDFPTDFDLYAILLLSPQHNFTCTPSSIIDDSWYCYKEVDGFLYEWKNISGTSYAFSITKSGGF
jgi:hypothetical protein